MKKKSHILLTSRIACRLFASNDKSLLWGSILPDFLYYTYLRRHTWETTRKKIFRKMRRLSCSGSSGAFGALSALRLGCILHYIEDYFTYPHNKNFTGTMEEHVKYENEQARLLSDYLINEKNMDAKSGKYLNFTVTYTNIHDVLSKLEELHFEYMNEKAPGMKNDLVYATRAVSMVCSYYIYAFARNKKRFFEFPACLKADYIVDIPGLMAKITFMTQAERKAA